MYAMSDAARLLRALANRPHPGARSSRAAKPKESSGILLTVRFSCGGRHDGTGRRQLQAEVSKAFDARLAHCSTTATARRDPRARAAHLPDEPGWAHSVPDAQIVEAASMSNEPAAPAVVVKIGCWADQGPARNSPPYA
jgi:hypothetical protein